MLQTRMLQVVVFGVAAAVAVIDGSGVGLGLQVHCRQPLASTVCTRM